MDLISIIYNSYIIIISQLFIYTYLDLRGTKLRDNGKVAEALRGLVAVTGGNGSRWRIDPHLHDEWVEYIVGHFTLQV